MQLATPDALRGRVSAVNMLFVGTSSELGAFESGVLASLFGAVPAVLVGGLGALVAAALWMRLFPALRRVDGLTAPGPQASDVRTLTRSETICRCCATPACTAALSSAGGHGFVRKRKTCACFAAVAASPPGCPVSSMRTASG